MKVFTLPVGAGRRVVIRTASPLDVDLYILMDVDPTTDTYLARGQTVSGSEAVFYTVTQNGVLHIGVYGYGATSHFTLKTSDV